ncbi:hypothetical protein BLA29_012638 [Euroglyphus maynei]|uniref:IGFBP N-terminal domain-containing protein n=1 Tax=Euroglyphus maynei TaxID=6958 RepID=A0A1Y3AXJ2_EURMA|nr:hypothetical protein BLA29_012638 [Euroglyphus maynei]
MNEMTTIVQAIHCEPGHCNGIQCSTPNCDAIPNGRYILKQGGICDCCPFCVRIFAKGENCGQTLIQPRTVGQTSTLSECEQGTRCDETTLKCV